MEPVRILKNVVKFLHETLNDKNMLRKYHDRLVKNVQEGKPKLKYNPGLAVKSYVLVNRNNERKVKTRLL